MRRAVLRCFVLRARCVELNRGLALVYLYVGVKIWVGRRVRVGVLYCQMAGNVTSSVFII